MEKRKIIAVSGAILMAIASYFLKEPVKDLICESPAPVVSEAPAPVMSEPQGEL